MKESPVLITGSTGFIGGNLIKTMAARGYPLLLLNRRRRDDIPTGSIIQEIFPSTCDEMEKLFQQYHPSGVIHLATEFAVFHNSSAVEKMIDANIASGMRLLEAAHKTDVPWFINTGTFWQHLGGAEYEPVNLYAATKQALESVAHYYRRVSHTKIVTLCLNDTYGRNDKRKKIFALWKDLIQNKSASMNMSPGEQLIDILHISDVCDGFIHLVNILNNNQLTCEDGDIFYLSSGKMLKLKELAGVFEEIAGCRLNINWGANGYREREVMLPACSGNPLPGWKAKISIECGITDFLREDDHTE